MGILSTVAFWPEYSRATSQTCSRPHNCTFRGYRPPLHTSNAVNRTRTTPYHPLPPYWQTNLRSTSSAGESQNARMLANRIQRFAQRKDIIFIFPDNMRRPKPNRAVRLLLGWCWVAICDGGFRLSLCLRDDLGLVDRTLDHLLFLGVKILREVVV